MVNPKTMNPRDDQRRQTVKNSSGASNNIRATISSRSMNMRKHLWLSITLLALLAAGCSRTDQQIASEVQAKINADTAFPDKQLAVTAANGVVTLSGNVSSDAARNAAANEPAQVPGVKTVINNLQVAGSAPALGTQPEPVAAGNTPPSGAFNPPAPAVAAKPSPRAHTRASGSSSASSRDYYSVDNSRPAGTDTASNTAPPPAAAPVAPPPPQPIVVPSGTQLSIRLTDELNSEKAQIGDVFHASVSTPVVVGDTTVIPTTADVEGRVVDVKSAGRFAGQSDLVIELTRLLLNGKSYPLATDRWSKAGSSRGKATAAKVGGGAAVGAILGGIFGGGKGAAIGAAAGAGAGTGVAGATKGQQIILKPETVLDFHLQNSLSVLPGSSRQPMNSQN